MIILENGVFLHATPRKAIDGHGFTVRSVTLTYWEEGKGEIRERSILLDELPQDVQTLYDVCLAAQDALDTAMRKAITEGEK